MKTKVIAMLAIIAICASSLSSCNVITKENDIEKIKEDVVVIENTKEPKESPNNIEYIMPKEDEEQITQSVETQVVIEPIEDIETPVTEEIEPIEDVIDEESEQALEEIVYKLVGLTFDDGPSSYTDELSQVLEENGHSATFFVVGNRLYNYEDELRQIIEHGHEIGIHTYSHTSFTKLGVNQTLDEINYTKSILDELGIEYTNLVRPPYGSVDSEIKEGVDFPMILWNVDTRDWESKDPNKVCDEILKGIEEGNIILLHDIHPTTIEGVFMALEQMPEGYKFSSISELVKTNGYDLEQGKCYYSLNKK